jgi:hypothetical protein
MTINSTKWPQNIPNFGNFRPYGHKMFIPSSSIARTSNIYPNWDFWFENKNHLATLVHTWNRTYICLLARQNTDAEGVTAIVGSNPSGFGVLTIEVQFGFHPACVSGFSDKYIEMLVGRLVTQLALLKCAQVGMYLSEEMLNKKL